MTDNQNLKLARVYRTIINDIEDVLGVSITGADEHRIMQSLMDAVDAAVIMMNDSVVASIDVEIGNLEDEVVDAAIDRLETFRKHGYETEHPSNLDHANLRLDMATTRLLTARKKAEQPQRQVEALDDDSEFVI